MDGTVGHNSDGIQADRLRSIIERVERLAEEAKALQSDVKEVFSEAKGNGYDVKIIRQILKLRSMDPNKLAETDSLLETYRRAMGI